jgi:hypothetical protein
VETLHGRLLAAVPSAIGLSMSIHMSEIDLTLTTLPEGGKPQTSLRVPLSTWADLEAGSEVIFYATTAGSLVDLAADLGWALGLNIAWTRQVLDQVLVLDQHLTPVPGLSGLSDLSALNQAVGVLLAKGRSPDRAIEDLKRAASLANSSIAGAARAIIGQLDRSGHGRRVDVKALPARARWDGTAGSGDHLCGLYRGEAERDEIMLPYLRAGLGNGDQCLCLIDRTDPAIIRDRLAGDAGGLDESRIDIRSASDVYLVNGEFIAEEMLEFLDETAAAVSAMEGDRRFRATGEMSWVTRDPQNFVQFFTYESELNRMKSAHAPALLCLFDLDDLDAPALDDVLRTHPTIVYEHGVIDNPYYRNPDDNLASR